MAKTFTIGHSNHKWNDFISILKDKHVDAVVDVRRYPGSRACPQFNKGQMIIATPPLSNRSEYSAIPFNKGKLSLLAMARVPPSRTACGLIASRLKVRIGLIYFLFLRMYPSP